VSKKQGATMQMMASDTSTSASAGLHEVFSAWVRRRPHAPALIWTGGQFSYADLDARASAWAVELAARGVCPGHLVPVILPRGVPLVCALLGILKAGGAYALLDPDWPEDRLAAALANLNPPFIVTEDLLQGHIRPDLSHALEPGVVESPAPDYITVSASPCCVYFTSGTTGQPKGVLSPHVGTSRLFEAGGVPGFNVGSIVPLAAATPWDAFSLELWGALLNGGTAWLPDEPFLTAGALRRGIAGYGVNTVWLTSSLFNLVVDEDPDAFVGLGHVIIGGERLSPGHVRRFLERHPRIMLLNGYGPVESSVFVSIHEIAPEDCDRREGIPLGRPVPHTDIFVLRGNQLQEPGELGEICVSGPGLALCYLGDENLTAEKFVDIEIAGSLRRVYRTGDLGCWSEDGLLFYGGRADRQLKLRGHRVEPTEVELQIERLAPEVRTCRVVARNDAFGAPRELIAFCIPNQAGDELKEVLARVSKHLPSFQRPAMLVSVPHFPLTSRGKLDEAALLESVTVEPAIPTAAEGEDEDFQVVRQTLSEVLGALLPTDADFFLAGGDSLCAARACARLGARLGHPVPVSLLYNNPTPQRLAFALERRRLAPPRPEGCGARLSEVQRLYLARALRDPTDCTSHCLMFWRFDDCPDLDALEAAIGDVHLRHEPLGAAYVVDPYPVSIPAVAPAPPMVRLAAQPTEDDAILLLRSEFAAPLAPDVGDVWWCAFVPVRTGGGVFGCVIHHVAFDGASEAILAADLAAAYRRRMGEPATIGPEPPSIAQLERIAYARHLAVDVNDLTARLSKTVAGVPPLDWSAGARTAIARGHDPLVSRLSVSTIVSLKRRARAADSTLFEVLFHRWVLALAAVTGQSDFAVGFPLRGRDFEGLSGAVGCHIGLGIVRVCAEVLRSDKAGLVAARAAVHGAMATEGACLSEVLGDAPRGAGRPPVFQTLFALQDNLAPTLSLTGVATEFRRQPYLQLPLELHGELWPEADGGLRLEIAWQADVVPHDVPARLQENFLRGLATLVERDVW
jgi:mycobactin peptide synthetase MbtE